MNETRFGIALYTVRDLGVSLPTQIRQAAAVGYEGVEFVHKLHGDFDVEAVADALDETDVEPVGVHVGLDELEAVLPALVERYRAVGCETFVVPHHPSSNLRTEAQLRRFVDRLNDVAGELNRRRCRLLYHPVHWDLVPLLDGPVLGRVSSFRPTDWIGGDSGPATPVRALEDRLADLGVRLVDRFLIGRGLTVGNGLGTLVRKTPLGYVLTETDPGTVGFELDIAFFEQQGYDPAAVVDAFGDRVTRIHAKDVVSSAYVPGRWPRWVDPGEGDVAFEPVLEAAYRNDVEWVLFENGHVVDPLSSITDGLRFLQSCAPPVDPVEATADESRASDAPTLVSRG